MSPRTIKVHGLNVEIFEKSFRVEGMSSVIFVGQSLVETKAIEIIGVLYEHYEKEFLKEIKITLKNKFNNFLERFID